jgi:hypothetical protein
MINHDSNHSNSPFVIDKTPRCSMVFGMFFTPRHQEEPLDAELEKADAHAAEARRVAAMRLE